MATPRQTLARTSLVRHLSELTDPRKESLCEHLFLEILLMALMAILCGAEAWDEIHDWASSKEPMLRKMLTLPNGIPSADTFRRVFARLRPYAFERAFRGWIDEMIDTHGARWIAIDGKTVRGVAKRTDGERNLHLVHAWCTRNGLLLGQVATDAKSNEITAIPELLRVLDLEGAIVTIDAMGCQRAIAAQIIEGGGDYVLRLKDNQPTLHAAVQAAVDRVRETAPDASSGWSSSLSEGHGRSEIRRVITADASTMTDRWEGLRSCGVIECERTEKGRTSIESHYFIASLLHHDAEAPGTVMRAHWGIENGLHWTLDVGFREDQCAVHEGHAPENLSLLRKIALTLLKEDTSFKAGIQRKRKRAGWDEAYLRGLLTREIT